MEQQTQQLHFTIKASFYNNIIRDAYWFEKRRKWAVKCIRCLMGITFKQESLFFTGNAIFEDREDGCLDLNTEYEDKEFKEKLTNFLFSNKAIPVNEIDRNGWLLTNGTFIEVPDYGHNESAYIICEKLKELEEFEYLPKQYERNLEINGAIKISGNNVMFDRHYVNITGAQVDAFRKFFKEYQLLDIAATNHEEIDAVPLIFMSKHLENYKDFETETKLFGYMDDDLLDVKKEKIK